MLNFYRFRQDYLKLEGNDRLDFINRLSTNQVNTLQQFKGTKTVLTSDKGRFVDLLTLYNFGDFVFAACSFNNSGNVLLHLEKYTIMDDFKPLNMSGTHETILFFGESSDGYIQDVFKIDTDGFSYNDFQIYVTEDHHSIIARNDVAFGGYMFIYASKDVDFWNKRIFTDELRKKFSMEETDDAHYNAKRIELGIPAFPNEMNDKTNPLESGLSKYVSFTKGCYIGQEVIARLDTYDKISKHLVKIISDLDLVEEGSKILIGGKECGFLTSIHRKSALGFVKTVFLDFDKEYTIVQNGNSINCKLEPINN